MMRRPRSSSAARRGFTLLEMMVVTGLTASVIGTLVLLAQRAQATASQATVEDGARKAVEHVLARIGRELADAGQGTLDPLPTTPFWTDELDFQTAAGLGQAGVVFSPTVRVEAVEDPADPANGLDDDGDGVVDERVLRLVSDDGRRTIVLTDQVSALGAGEVENGQDDDGDGLVDEPGFSITLVEGCLHVELTVERPRPDGDTAVVSGEIRTWLRND